MKNSKNFKVIPEIFNYLTKDFDKREKKPILGHKLNDKYVDISYKQFEKEIINFTFGLETLGVKREKKIAIISENRPEWIYSDMAILSLGAINVPLYPISTADQIKFILIDSQSEGIIVSNSYQLNKLLKIKDECKHLKYIIVLNDMDLSNYENIYTFKEVQQLGNKYQEEYPDLLKDSIAQLNEEDICTIIYTSGTTGEPKGVMLTHSNIMSNVISCVNILPVDYNDVFLSFLPLCHIFERMAGYYLALYIGATIYFAESIEKIATNFLEVKPTVMTAVPRLFERMYTRIKKNVESQKSSKQKIFEWAIDIGRKYAQAIRYKENIPIGLNVKHKLAQKLVYKKLKARTGGRIRFMISGGAPLPRELGEFFEAVGLIILEGYGLTESSPVIAVNRADDYRYGSVGKIIPGVEVKIAKDGEILVRGPNVMKGYYNNKKETDATLIDGWLHTGDIGVFDAQGFLIITDRKKHLFKTSGGKYVAPAPIENLFSSSRYVDQFVLIGDKRTYLSALIVPDFDAIKEYADAHRIQYSSDEELVKMKQINELLDEELAKFQKNLATFEKVRKFTLLERPFSIENGELTPKLSVRRKVIEERYRDLIDEMYRENK
ncbi:MAG: long-chain fatty acid--CoA ligase [Ignavibacteriales bacterium]|nr:long-chain fatty acid--CoA ligase [Ignavibacteriales bacterium]